MKEEQEKCVVFFKINLSTTISIESSPFINIVVDKFVFKNNLIITRFPSFLSSLTQNRYGATKKGLCFHIGTKGIEGLHFVYLSRWPTHIVSPESCSLWISFKNKQLSFRAFFPILVILLCPVSVLEAAEVLCGNLNKNKCKSIMKAKVLLTLWYSVSHGLQRLSASGTLRNCLRDI